MDMTLLKDLIEVARYEAYSYSGRGMYGRQCVGLTCSDVTTAIADIVEACMSQYTAVKTIEQVMDEHRALCDALRQSASDNMGLDKVLYFKSVEWKNEQD